MLKFVKGNLFDSQAEALVNTVNCVGVMGKGLALQFKRKYPDNFRVYQEACDDGFLKPGRILVFDRQPQTLSYPKYILNFATKRHWRNRSQLQWIMEGLDNLVEVIGNLKIKSVVIPALGCKNGGLDWKMVRKIIEVKLNDLPCDIAVYEPLEI